jgi:hypothetical protein
MNEQLRYINVSFNHTRCNSFMDLSRNRVTTSKGGKLAKVKESKL